MIVDRLENIQVYFGDETMLSRALHFAKAFSPMQPDGKYEIEGSMIYALCKTYTTKPTREGTFENHKEYIDIQVILEGHEMMGHTLEADLVPQTAYNRDKDSQKYASPKAYN
ncbi:MAG: YhcH/YjgK/YiaL family protein, partial [Planctomycetes bacterium]|nr:YhcH/YjgK/YiaL family protein [Planctomycetota bacterium]